MLLPFLVAWLNLHVTEPWGNPATLDGVHDCLFDANDGIGPCNRPANATWPAAKERYEAARLGPTRDERAIADAKVEVTAAAVVKVAARVSKLRTSAPADGTIALLVRGAWRGDRPGAAIADLVQKRPALGQFQFAEDQIYHLRIGSRVELTPAGGNAPIDARIDEIIPRGQFATWRAARAVGDYDLNTFLIRARPVRRWRGASARDVALDATAMTKRLGNVGLLPARKRHPRPL